MPHAQNTVCVLYRLLGGPAVRCTLRPYAVFRRHDAPPAITPGDRSRSTSRAAATRSARREPARAALQLQPGPTRSWPTSARPACVYREERERGYDHTELSSAPATSRCDLRPDRPVVFVATTETGIARRSTPARCSRRNAAPARRLLALAPQRRRGIRRAAGARGGPVPRPARQPPRGSVPRRRAARGAHRHRRLPLVHRLGPRHDDRPRGPDARHRPLREAGGDPAHLRALRERRAAAEPVSRRRARGALQHGRRDALVLPRARALRRATGDDDCCATCSRCSRRSSRTTCRHALRHRRRSGGRPARRRRPRAISSPGWTRRSTTGW